MTWPGQGAAPPGRTPRWGLRAWTLRTRLVVLIIVLVATGLLVVGVTSVVLMRRSLEAQVDDKLAAQGQAVASSALTRPDGDLLSDYAVQVRTSDSQLRTYVGVWVADRYGVPRLPELTVAQAQATGQRPFTVGATGSDARWRAVAYTFGGPAPGGAGTGPSGTVVVALPLGGVESTMRTMVQVLVLSGAAIVVAGALAGGLAVRRSLRPLRQIEATAAAIAAGDLSRRVPTAPQSTEVGRLGAALNGMLAQIEQAFAVRAASETRMRRFVSDASHELRTPLAAVRGYAELYRMGALGDDTAVRDTMSRIEESAKRMGVLVEDLLTLARMDEGRPLDLRPVDLVVLASDAAADLHALDPDRQVRVLGLDGELAPCEVDGDAHQLRQVLTNLVGNVVRHTPPGTPVELAVGYDQAPGTTRRGVVEVRDHGPGIAPEHAARVFERFYRVDPSRTRDSGGAGLGMAIVAAAVAAHHGEVTVSTTPGGGATVRVVLPSAPTRPGAETDEPAEGGPTAREAPRDGATG